MSSLVPLESSVAWHLMLNSSSVMRGSPSSRTRRGDHCTMRWAAGAAQAEARGILLGDAFGLVSYKR